MLERNDPLLEGVEVGGLDHAADQPNDMGQLGRGLGGPARRVAPRDIGAPALSGSEAGYPAGPLGVSSKSLCHRSIRPRKCPLSAISEAILFGFDAKINIFLVGASG